MHVCMYIRMYVCKFNVSIGRCSRQMYSRHVLDECSREGQVSPTNSVSYKLKVRIAAQVLIYSVCARARARACVCVCVCV
jgi:hypothetical protein